MTPDGNLLDSVDLDKSQFILSHIEVKLPKSKGEGLAVGQPIVSSLTHH